MKKTRKMREGKIGGGGNYQTHGKSWRKGGDEKISKEEGKSQKSFS
jgi:hypothetical protein